MVKRAGAAAAAAGRSKSIGFGIGFMGCFMSCEGQDLSLLNLSSYVEGFN